MGATTEIRVVFDRVCDNDPDVMERDDLAADTADVAVLERWLAARKVRIARRTRALAEQGRSESPKDLFIRHGGQSSKNARADEERERVCSQMPGFEEALAAGTVSAGHVDAVVNATRNLDPAALAEFASHTDDLIRDAATHSVDAFDKTAREMARFVNSTQPGASDTAELDRQRAASNIRRWVDKSTGMWHTHIELDPIRDTEFHTAIARSLATLRRQPGNATTPWKQLEVDALIHAVQHPGDSDTGADGVGKRVELVTRILVLIDLDTMLTGLHANSVCELADGTPLPVSVVRQMACDAEIIPAVLDGNGVALDLGRGKRLADTNQRWAMTTMFMTCAFPDCDVPVDRTRAHHVDEYHKGGLTNLARLAPLCEEKGHHTLIHSGGWTFTMTDDFIGTFTRPDGTTHYHGPLNNRAPNGIAKPAA